MPTVDVISQTVPEHSHSQYSIVVRLEGPLLVGGPAPYESDYTQRILAAKRLDKKKAEEDVSSRRARYRWPTNLQVSGLIFLLFCQHEYPRSAERYYETI